MAERKKPAATTRSARQKKAAAKKKAAPKKTRSTKSPAKAKPKEPQLPTLKTAMAWIGMPIDGTDKNLGKVAGIHVDVQDGKPRWVVVRLGRLAGCTALPFDHVAEGGDRLFAAYERAWVREAPRFKPDDALSADQELEMCAHWGIRMERARAAEVKDRKPDEISAVPAES
jgi:hypothetical protein